MTVNSIESLISVTDNLSGGMPCNPLACQFVHLPLKHRQGLVVHIMSLKVLHVICCPSVVSRYGCRRVQHFATKPVFMYILQCTGSPRQKMPQHEKAYADAVLQYNALCSTSRCAAWNRFADILRYLVF